MFGTGPFCSWLLEPCMPGLHSVPDCQADPMCVAPSSISHSRASLPLAGDAVMRITCSACCSRKHCAHLLRLGSVVCHALTNAIPVSLKDALLAIYPDMSLTSRAFLSGECCWKPLNQHRDRGSCCHQAKAGSLSGNYTRRIHDAVSPACVQIQGSSSCGRDALGAHVCCSTSGLDHGASARGAVSSLRPRPCIVVLCQRRGDVLPFCWGPV